MLFDDPEFNHRLKQRWFELRENILSIARINQFIDAVADTLAEAQERNFAIWSAPGERGEGFWPVPGIFRSFHTYQDEVDYLKLWISNRIKWIDENIILLSSVAQNELIVPQNFMLSQNYPNPFNPTTHIEYSLPQIAHIRLTIIGVLGQFIKTLVDTKQTAGQFQVTWDGTDECHLPVASGIYLCRMEVMDYANSEKNFVKVIKLALIR